MGGVETLALPLVEDQPGAEYAGLACVLTDFVWIAAIIALLIIYQRLLSWGYGPYAQCPRCGQRYQSCEAYCPICAATNDETYSRVRHSKAEPRIPEEFANAPEQYDYAVEKRKRIERDCLRTSRASRPVLAALVAARIAIWVGFCILMLWWFNNQLKGLDDGIVILWFIIVRDNTNSLGLFLCWFLFEIATSCLLLGNGAWTRQGPATGASPVLVWHWRGELRGMRPAWRVVGWYWATEALACMFVLMPWLYGYMYVRHPLRHAGLIPDTWHVTSVVLAAELGMYVLNTLCYLLSVRVGYVVNDVRLTVPRGGWEDLEHDFRETAADVNDAAASGAATMPGAASEWTLGGAGATYPVTATFFPDAPAVAEPAAAPGTAASDASAPGISSPGASSPGASAPDASTPNSSSTGTSTPSAPAEGSDWYGTWFGKQ